jgi:hypothetical protein
MNNILSIYWRMKYIKKGYESGKQNLDYLMDSSV